MNISAKTLKLLTAIGAILTGLFFAGLSAVIIFSPKHTYLTTQGTISDIEEYYDYSAADDTNNLMHDVYVDYEVDGVKYERALYGAYDSSMDIGDTVDVEYQEDDPSVIQAPGSDKIPYITGAVGVAALIFGVYSLVKYKKLANGDDN